MSKRWPCSFVLAGMLITGVGAAADALPLDFSFTFSADSFSTLPGVTVGDIVTGHIIFESSTPDFAVASDQRGIYLGSVRSASLTAGGQFFEVSDFDSSDVGIVNDLPNGFAGGFSDGFSMQASRVNSQLEPLYLAHLRLNLISFSPQPLSLTTADTMASLPSTFDFADWNLESVLTIGFGQPGSFQLLHVSGTTGSATLGPATSVPEPSSLILFGSGVVALLARARRMSYFNSSKTT